MNYFVARDRNSLQIKIYDGDSADAYLIWRKGSKFGVERTQPKLVTRIARFDGNVRGSLMNSLFTKVPSNWVASRFMDAYLLDENLESLSAGAKFWFTVEKKYDGPQFVKYGEVLQTSLDIGGETLRRTLYRYDGGAVFMTARDLLSEKKFFAPVGYLRIASPFQSGRRHPITGRLQPHLGIDFELPLRSPVYAPMRGTVVRMGRNRAAGVYVVILHPNGIETAYNHLTRWMPGLREGSHVSGGQVIAETGSTGYSTRPHLHFAVRKRGRLVDPAPFIRHYPEIAAKALQERVATKDF